MSWLCGLGIHFFFNSVTIPMKLMVMAAKTVFPGQFAPCLPFPLLPRYHSVFPGQFDLAPPPPPSLAPLLFSVSGEICFLPSLSPLAPLSLSVSGAICSLPSLHSLAPLLFSVSGAVCSLPSLSPMFCSTMNVLMLNYLLRCDCIIIYVYDIYCLVFFFSLSWHPSFYLPCIILLCDSSLCDCMYYIYMYRCFSPPSLFLPVCQWHVAFDLSYLLQIHNSTPVLIVRPLPSSSLPRPPPLPHPHPHAPAPFPNLQPTPHALIPYVDPTNSTCNSSRDFVPFRTMSALMFIFQGLSLMLL